MDYLSRKLKEISREHETRFRNGFMRCSICGAPAVGQNMHTLEYFCANPEHEQKVWDNWVQSDK